MTGFAPQTPAEIANMLAPQTAGPGQPLPAYKFDHLVYMYTADPFPLSAVPLSSGFDYPVGGLNHEGYNIITCFGCNVDWLGDYGHTAEDYANGYEGGPVYSVSDGRVLWRGVGPNAYGNVLIVQYNVQGATIFGLYAHLRDIDVVPGQVVARRQQIATVGQSGTFLPHLHFEMRTKSYIAPRGYTFTNFSGPSVDFYGMTFYAPSWYIENHRHMDSPFGSIDRTRLIPGGFKVSGWAIDQNTAGPIFVQTYLDGQGAPAGLADGARPDVAGLFPQYGAGHGYDIGVAAAAGSHGVCAYGLNFGPGNNSFLGCLGVRLTGDPFGSLDTLALGADGQLHATGWSIDPDTASPIDVRFYDNGQYLGGVTASASRPDLAQPNVYPEFGPAHGFDAAMAKFAGDNNVCAYAINVSAGSNMLLGCRSIFVSLDEFPLTPADSGRRYYWPWYDGSGGPDWLFMANPSAAAPLGFSLNLAGRSLNLSPMPSVTVGPRQVFSMNFLGISGGPAELTSLTGDPAIVCQRVLWAGKSLEETPGIDEDKLADHYYWSWYDEKKSGVRDWVMLANPNGGIVFYQIRIAGQTQQSGLLTPPGDPAGRDKVISEFPGMIGGPVEVQAWFDNFNGNMPAKIIASQRVLSQGGGAFNEAQGIAATGLADHYIWNWYDDHGPGSDDWIMLANPSAAADVYYQVKVGGQVKNSGKLKSAGDPQGEDKSALTFPGLAGGPVEVQAWSDRVDGTSPANIIASQRSLWGPSFEEVPGYPYKELASSYDWSWYDQRSPGSLDWVMVANPSNTTDIYYQVSIGGQIQPPSTTNPGMINRGSNILASFPGVMNGPVEIKAWSGDPDPAKGVPASIITSQRVLWNGYFNEVVGRATP